MTRRFKDLLKSRAARDSEFRVTLLQEAVESFVRGDTGNGRAALRTYVNATLGFAELGQALGKRPQSLMRMLGPAGNPTAENLFALMAFLQEREGVTLNVSLQQTAAS